MEETENWRLLAENLNDKNKVRLYPAAELGGVQSFRRETVTDSG